MSRILWVLLAFGVLGAGIALAANPEPFTVQITIRQAITISKLTDLDFGAVDSGAATYTVTPDGNPQGGAGTGAVAASFTINGEATQTANVSVTPDPITITNATDNLSVDLTPQNTTHTFAGGDETFYVGGTVTLTGGESSGLYTGAAQLELVYQ